LIHELPLERRTLHGHFSRDLEPIVAVDAGDSIAFSCPNAGWYLASGERFEPRVEELDAGHALIGPVEVRGARAGGTLTVTIDEVSAAGWGVTFGHEVRLDWTREDGVWLDEMGRRAAPAATSTARSSWRARRSSCRSRSTVPCSPAATGTGRRGTGRCAGTRSRCR